VEIRVQLEVGVSGFIVCLATQKAIRFPFPVNISIQDGKVAVSFHVPSELNVHMDTIQLVKEACSFDLKVCDDGKLV
jgi:hypothetical protein